MHPGRYPRYPSRLGTDKPGRLFLPRGLTVARVPLAYQVLFSWVPVMFLDHEGGPEDKKRRAQERLAKKIQAREKLFPFPGHDRPGAQMRYVFRQDEKADLTDDEKGLRRLLHQKPGEYHERMLKYEKEERDRPPGEYLLTAGKPPPDEVTAKLLETIEEMLAKVKVGAK